MKIDTDTIAAALLHPRPEVHLHYLGQLEKLAVSRLRAACERLNVKSKDLLHDDRAVTFNLQVQSSDQSSSSERRAGMLLRWCIYAREQGMNEIAKVRVIGALREFDADDAAHGKTMRDGRKRGTVGPVRLAVRKALKRSPDDSAAQVWSAIKAKPPKGMALYETPKLGKYIQSDGAPDTGYRRFATIVSEEKNPKPNQK